MTLPLSHEETQAVLGALALDALSDVERRAALAHVAACQECTAELSALRDAAASLAFAVPAAVAVGDAERAAATRSRLMARARAGAEPRRTSVGESGELPVTRTTLRVQSRRRNLPASAWAALAAAVAFLAVLAGWVRTRAEMTQLNAELFAVRSENARRMDSLNATLDGLTAPEVRVVDLTATGPRPPSARMFWNTRTSRWTLFAHFLAPPAAGKTYQLWLVTNRNEKISAGTFTPDSIGHAVLQADYALAGGPAALQTIAVTLEPAGGVPQPTGPIIIAGNATR